ncbi:MAG: ankyrin repeat domain-containing protein, partial [Francisellaceae bacterium]|nr:ankyrin repeat domain-containing protein [Francisellaceae bacterium]
SGKISEFYKSIHDDMARGITRNIDALKRNMDALIQQREFIVEQAVDTADTETLWSIVGLGDTLNSDLIRRIIANPNANIEILEQMLGHINDVSIFEQLLAREDILNTDEQIVDFMTSVLSVMMKLKDKLSAEELASLQESIEKIKRDLNSLHNNLISNSTLLSNGAIDGALLRISANEFTSAPTLNTLMGQCLYHGHIDVVIDVCNHKNADSDTIQMVVGYLHGAQTISLPLVETLILSPHANECVILSLIANDRIENHSIVTVIRATKWKYVFAVSDALSSNTLAVQEIEGTIETAQELNVSEKNEIDDDDEPIVRNKKILRSKKRNKKIKKSSQVKNESNLQVLPMETIPELTKEEKNKRSLEVQAGKLYFHLNSDNVDRFTFVHKYLMHEKAQIFAGKILMFGINSEVRTLLLVYLKSDSSISALNSLLYENTKAVKEPKFQIVNDSKVRSFIRKILLLTPEILGKTMMLKLSTLAGLMIDSLISTDFHLINGGDVELDSPLSIALKIDNQLLACKLINLGANLSCSDGRNCLLIAANRGLLEVAQCVLNTKDGISLIDMSGNVDLSTALHLNIHDKIINKRDTVMGESTPLDYAILQGHECIAIELINRGANVGISNSPMKTHLIGASMRGMLGLVDCILNVMTPCDFHMVNEIDSRGATAIDHLIININHCSYDEMQSVAVKIINFGYDLNKSAKYGKHDILPTLCIKGLGQILVAILGTKSGAKLINERYNGFTLLDMALGNGANEIAEQIIRSGAYLYPILGWNGETPLITAAKTKNAGIVSLILEYTKSDEEPLTCIRDKEGLSALDYAQKSGYDDIAELIKSYHKKHHKAPSLKMT